MPPEAQAAWCAEFARTRRSPKSYGYDMAQKASERTPLRDRPVAELLAAISRRCAERQAETSAIGSRRFFKWVGADAQQALNGRPASSGGP